jgi:hypothetical protein
MRRAAIGSSGRTLAADIAGPIAGEVGLPPTMTDLFGGALRKVARGGSR